MPEFIDMLALPLPHTARADSHVIGWRHHDAISNAQFRAETEAWRQALVAHPGRRFALYLADTLCFATALLGAWQAGKTVYLPGDTLPDTCQALSNEVDGFIGDFPARWQPLPAPAAAASAQGSAESPLPLAGDFVGLVVYTSGSTGAAQAIPKKLSQMSREVATLDALFGALMGRADVVATVSHQHIYGLLFKVLWPLCAGRAIHARSAFFPEDLAAIVPARPWLLLSSPAHLKRLPESPVQPDITHLQGIFSSGGPLLPEVAAVVRRQFGQRPIEIYGSSETGGIAWRQPQQENGDDCWQAMPQVEVRGNAVDDSLEVRSPHLPDHAWLRMADRVEFTGQQRFYLRGRADRIVKLEEKRISLDQIERLLLASPLVAEARVMLHQASGQRERIAAFVVLTASGRDMLQGQGKLALNARLRAALVDGIDSVALPRLWRYPDIMPTDPQGKTSIAALTALLEKPPTPSVPPAPATFPTTRPLLPAQTVLQRSHTHVTLQLHVPEDLLYFAGHFPAMPILPGVAQVSWALEFGGQYFDLPPDCIGMQALKFQRVILPGAIAHLELNNDAQKNVLTFRLYSAQGQHASGRILFGAAT